MTAQGCAHRGTGILLVEEKQNWVNMWHYLQDALENDPQSLTKIVRPGRFILRVSHI
jgi:hypothetical protein